MTSDTQGQSEHKDPFSAKLQEIDREFGMFEGKKKGPNPEDSELQINMPQNPPLVSWGFSNFEGKARGVEDRQELPKHVGPDEVCVKVTGPFTIGPSLGNSTLPFNGFDVGQAESSDQDFITKPIYLRASQEVQGRKWTRFERLAPVKTSQNVSPPLTREGPPPEVSDTQPVKRKEVSNNESPTLSVSSTLAVY